MTFPLFFPAVLILLSADLERGEEPSGEGVLRLIQDRLSDAEFGKNLANLSNQFAANADRQFQFDKRSQLFIRIPNETLPVPAMRVSNEDRPSVKIHS